MPPPAPLAKVTMSGTAPECWKANHFPVRPKPDMTSSLIHSTSLGVAEAAELLEEAGRRDEHAAA